MMTGPILVTGGTGTLGRVVVSRLRQAGTPVRVLSRRPAPPGEDVTGWATGDLRTGAGIDSAVAGVPAIVHCATSPARGDEGPTGALLDAARRAGVGHVVYISIVGVDRVPLPYYRHKLATERLVEGSGIPYTILRATQFHDLVAWFFDKAVRVPRFLAVPAGMRVQPIEVDEVADRLVSLTCAAPAGRVPDEGGPQVRGVPELAAAYLHARGLVRQVVEVPLPGRTARAFREGGHLAPDQAVGRTTFEEYLAARHPGDAAPSGRSGDGRPDGG